MWNAIDLHMHSVQGITRDGGVDNVEFSYCEFVDVMLQFDLKLMAVTNHNVIDLGNFILMNYLATKFSRNMLLGVEIDTFFADQVNKPLHLIAISEKNFDDNFCLEEEVNSIANNKKRSGEVVFGVEDLITIMRKHNLVMIPHGAKSRGFFDSPSEENIKSALKIVREGFIRVFDSPSDWKLERIKQFITAEKYVDNIDDFGGVLFSDIRIWKDYKTKFRDFYMNSEPTFKGLLHSLSNPTKRFSKRDHIRHNNNYISKVKIIKKTDTLSSNLSIQEGEISFDRGYNCIIGKSGSGKSLLLEIIKMKLLNTYNDKYSFLKDYETQVFDENDNELNFTNASIGIGENIYDKIITANTSSDNEDMYKIISYLNDSFKPKVNFKTTNKKFEDDVKNYVKTKLSASILAEQLKRELITFNSEEIKLRSLKDLRTFSIDIPSEKELTYSQKNINDFGNFQSSLDDLKTYSKIYLGSELQNLSQKIDDLERLFKVVSNKMKQLANYETFSILKQRIIKTSINSVNGESSKNAQEKSTILTSLSDNIERIIKNLIDYKKQAFKIEYSIVKYDVENSYEETIINETSKIKVIQKIDEKHIVALSEKSNQVFKTYGKRANLEDTEYDITKSIQTKELLDKYIKESVIDENFTLSDKFDVSVDIYFDTNNIKKLNPGDIAKTYLEVYFNEKIINSSNSIIIFDQLENDVDKDFISTTIKEQISRTKGNVQLIVVTHDPIIAVNADPTNYIQATKSGSTIIYRNFRAESSDRDELLTIANTVDGSKSVIKNRYEIYKGEIDHEN